MSATRRLPARAIGDGAVRDGFRGPPAVAALRADDRDPRPLRGVVAAGDSVDTVGPHAVVCFTRAYMGAEFGAVRHSRDW